MSKRSSDGDVLSNRLNLGFAKNQKLLASWMGTQVDAQETNDTSKNEEEDNELKQNNYGHDRLGVGGIRPKDLEDGTFMKRGLSSSDKLLEQLIGKKKAKAHLASKLQATRLGAQPQPKQNRRDVMKKEDSEDEEEGRTAAFNSKKRRVAKPKQTAVKDEEHEDEEHDPVVPATDEPIIKNENEAEQVVEAPKVKEEDDQEADVLPIPAPTKSIPSRGKAKPVSYLDELLAERSKKKKNKAKNKGTTET